MNYLRGYDDKKLLEPILGSIEIVQKYGKTTEETFDKSILRKDAICHRMHNISIAINQLSDKLKAKYQKVDWVLYKSWLIDYFNPYSLYEFVSEEAERVSGKTELELLFYKIEAIYLNEFPS